MYSHARSLFGVASKQFGFGFKMMKNFGGIALEQNEI